VNVREVSRRKLTSVSRLMERRVVLDVDAVEDVLVVEDVRGMDA
jgi:hypothetical protein